MSPDHESNSPLESCLVPPDRLRWTCSPERYSFGDTSEMEESPIEIIGQPRAMEALKLGVEMRSEGYNIFVAGEVGSGRSTTVRRVIAAMERGEQAPEDLVYVYNFKDPDRPRLLAFPAGRGRAFRDAMQELVQTVRRNLPRMFESEAYRERRSTLIEQAKEQHKSRLKEFEERVAREGFTLVQIQMGEVVRPDILPLLGKEPVALEQLEAMVEQNRFERDEFERLKEVYAKLSGEMVEMSKELRDIQRGLRRKLAELDRNLAQPFVREAVEDLVEAFESVEVREYLEEASEDFLDRLDRFRQLAEQDPTEGDGGSERSREAVRELTLPYTANLLVDNTSTRGRPVLWESSPTYRNLFGIIERTLDASGMSQTDHTRIKAGSLIRANGGFLVVDALDALIEPGVWPSLKRALRTHEVEIQSFDPRSNLFGASLQPEPVPLDVKVVMIGTPHIYRQLYALDEDFKKIFKIKAEFAYWTELSDEELTNYGNFVQKKCKDDGLPPFLREAVAAVVEHGVRLSGRHGKLTTQFNRVADVIRESGYWARRAGSDRVHARHVDQAIERQRSRVDLLQETLREKFVDGALLVDLEGETVGQVNGLVILDIGDYQFGQPCRITAVTAMGRSGIIDIERESEMAGSIHTKGVLILAGFLRERFAQDKPLTLSASLCFEQSYAPVEGDSASCAELFALLSSLADVPLRQGIAVTGSVNQRGEVQPIGGINAKIEGYYDVCRMKGLNGEQGVIIPARNRSELMLRKDVVEAVRAGRFRVWAISSVEEGIEILSGTRAGVRGEGGEYPADTVFGRVDRRLARLAEGVREYGAADLPL